MQSQEIGAYIGRETTIEALGQTWTVQRLSRGIWNEFFKWAKTVLPDPLEVARAHLRAMAGEEWKIVRTQQLLGTDPNSYSETDKKLLAEMPYLSAEYLEFALKKNREEQENMYREAIALGTSHLSLGSPQATSLIQSHDGASHLLALLLKKHHPDIDDDVAYHIVESAGLDQIQKAFDVASGQAPPTSKNGTSPAEAA